MRKVLASVRLTADRDDYIEVAKLPEDADFFRYQSLVNPNPAKAESHKVIKNYIAKKGKDYRYETKPNPIEALRDRTQDNISVGLCPDEAGTK